MRGEMMRKMKRRWNWARQQLEDIDDLVRQTYTGRVMQLMRLPSIGSVWLLDRKFATMSAVPSPACTSKSTIAMRLSSGWQAKA
jgi:hypothetical protein